MIMKKARFTVVLMALLMTMTAMAAGPLKMERKFEKHITLPKFEKKAASKILKAELKNMVLNQKSDDKAKLPVIPGFNTAPTMQGLVLERVAETAKEVAPGFYSFPFKSNPSLTALLTSDDFAGTEMAEAVEKMLYLGETSVSAGKYLWVSSPDYGYSMIFDKEQKIPVMVSFDDEYPEDIFTAAVFVPEENAVYGQFFDDTIIPEDDEDTYRTFQWVRYDLNTLTREVLIDNFDLSLFVGLSLTPDGNLFAFDWDGYMIYLQKNGQPMYISEKTGDAEWYFATGMPVCVDYGFGGYALDVDKNVYYMSYVFEMTEEDTDDPDEVGLYIINFSLDINKLDAAVEPNEIEAAITFIKNVNYLIAGMSLKKLTEPTAPTELNIVPQRQKSDIVYNLAGQRVLRNNAKGLMIKQGKKIVK